MTCSGWEGSALVGLHDLEDLVVQWAVGAAHAVLQGIGLVEAVRLAVPIRAASTRGVHDGHPAGDVPGVAGLVGEGGFGPARGDQAALVGHRAYRDQNEQVLPWVEPAFFGFGAGADHAGAQKRVVRGDPTGLPVEPSAFAHNAR